MKNASSPLLSIVIPVYNVVRFLTETLESIQSQQYHPIEVIVVDDGSKPESKRALQRICSNFSDVTLIHQENGGQSVARKNGMLASKGKYIWFMDADDIFIPGAVEHLVNALERNPEAVAAYGRKIRIDKNSQPIEGQMWPRERDIVSGDILPALLKGVNLLTPGNICARRDAYDGVLFPEKMKQGEDWVMFCHLAHKGKILYAGDQLVLGYRVHQDNISNKVLETPSKLFRMVDMVCKDQMFVDHIGAKTISRYRKIHRQVIRNYYAGRYAEQHRKFLSWYYGKFWRTFAPKELKSGDDQLPIKSADRIRVVHIVKGLYAGGCERLLQDILKLGDHTKYEHVVLSLSDKRERIATVWFELNIPFYSMQMPDDQFRIRDYKHIYTLLRRIQPDVAHCWMHMPNIAGGIISKLMRIPVIWSIHNFFSAKGESKTELRLANMVPKRIVCCSNIIANAAVKTGFPPEKLQTIFNGTNTEAFKFSPVGRKKIRDRLGIAESTPVIGLAAEYQPNKRHLYFLRAAKELLEKYPNTHFLLCGHAVHGKNIHLTKLIKFLGLEDNVYLLGTRNDMRDFYSSLDILTLCSEEEAFGLAVTEAMACETLCVTSGTMKELTQETGISIPVSDNPELLSEAWGKLLSLEAKKQKEMKSSARKKIVDQYSILSTAKGYEALYSEMHEAKRSET